MTIRNRITTWYATTLLVAILIMGGGMYYELVYERERTKQLGQPPEPFAEEMGEVLLYFAAPALLVALIGGWWLLKRSLAPLDQLASAAERVSLENVQEPLPRTGNGDEVDRLSQVLNAKNSRLSDAMKEIHEFTLHASHELKTPITILHTEIETALAKAPDEQRDSLANQLNEIQRLTRIVEGLSLVARTNSGQLTFAQDLVAFHDLVQEMAEDVEILGRQMHVSVQVKAIEPSFVRGDRHRLRQMLLNLAENASAYNKRDGEITIELRVQDGAIVLEIGNTGEGIKDDDLPNIFKKFHRGSSASTQNPGGTGLGLSIVQSIVKVHHGEVAADTTRRGWTTMRVTLPTIPPPNRAQ